MKAIRRILTKNSAQIEKAKQKIKEEAKKGVMKLKDKLPSIDELKDKFSEQSCDAPTVAKMERDYEKLKNILSNLKSKIKSSIEKLEALKSKLEGAKSSLESIASITDAAEKLISPLKKVVTIADVLLKGVGMIPGQFSFPAGPLIMAKDGAKLAEGKIKEITSSVEVYSKAVNRPIGQIDKILKLLDKAIGAVKNLESQLLTVEGLMSAIFMNFLQNCVEMNDPLASGSNGTSPEDLLNNNDYPGYGLNNNDGVCSIPGIMTQQECEDAGGVWTLNTSGTILDVNPFDEGYKWWQLYQDLLDDLYLYGTNEIIEHAFRIKETNTGRGAKQVLGYRRYNKNPEEMDMNDFYKESPN